ncbi:MAG: response regulator [Candidatus Aerophobetes bacterium]
MAEKVKILAIEDDSEMVEFIKTVLEAHSYEVHSASTQKEGLEKVKEVSPDLIILDVMLETKGAGFWLAQKLRSKDPDSEFKEYSNLPILVMTAIHTQSEFHFSPETDREYLPVDDFVEKPIKPKEFIEKVEKLLRG